MVLLGYSTTDAEWEVRPPGRFPVESSRCVLASGYVINPAPGALHTWVYGGLILRKNLIVHLMERLIYAEDQ